MRINKQKITKELCLENELLFLPKTHDESVAIQQRIFDLGYAMSVGKSTSKAPQRSDLFLQHGIVLSNGLVYRRSENDKRDYLICRLSQFDRPDEADLTPQEQRNLFDQFNDLARRVGQMEKLLADIHEAVTVQKTIYKPQPPKREPNTP